MIQQVDTRVPGAVEEQVHLIYVRLYPNGSRGFVSRAFTWAMQSFSGRYADYQAIDARYHDFEHTLQGTLCLGRLLAGRAGAKAAPEVPAKMFELALLAILFHDTGYLKKKADSEGTGAKYTPIHVGRSATFAQEFLSAQGYGASEIMAIQNMIGCTGVNADLQAIPFQSEMERMLGFALGTADLLGQMSARDYVEKLPILAAEFAEAAHYSEDTSSRFALLTSAEALIRNTPAFWENYVRPKINGDFGQLYKFLNDPYPDGPNHYVQRVEQNIARLRQQLAATPR